MMLEETAAQLERFWPERYLKDKQKAYTMHYIRTLGYEPALLSEKQLAIIFNTLARSEEFTSSRRHNKHNWEVTFAPYCRQQLRHRAFLEELIEFWASVKEIAPIPELSVRWPEGKRFALVLSHDVDHLVPQSILERIRQIKHASKASVDRKTLILLNLLKLTVDKIRSSKPNWMALDQWMEIEARYGFKSSFFFLAQPLPQPHHEDSFYMYSDYANYKKERKSIRAIIRCIAETEWEVGLHGSINAHADALLLEQERSILEQEVGKEVISLRQHHLCYDIRYTPEVQAKAGFQADSSIGSNNSADYRCGTGLPFFMYSREHKKELDLLEIPLIIQDVALMRVQQMDETLAVNHCLELLHDAAARKSAITILWHNSFSDKASETKVYEKILQEASELGAWGCSVAEINHWWRKRSKLALQS
jgi:hypothetical protein